MSYPYGDIKRIAQAAIDHRRKFYEAYHPDAARIIADKALEDGVLSITGIINHIEYWLGKLRSSRWDGSIA